MADNFGDAWMRARLYLPAVPPLLVRDFVQDAYTRACAYRDWAFLRAQGFLSIQAARSVTCSPVQGSTALASSTTDFLATDVGRQFRIGTSPLYTVQTFTSTALVVLDQPYAGPSLTDTTGQVLDALATLPADFDHFLVIADPYYQRPIPYWISEDQIGLADPAMTVSGPIRYLTSWRTSSLPATLGQLQYRYWPLPTEARQYPYLYIRLAEKLTDTSPFQGVFANRADLFKLGAQLAAAEWPGTTDLKNPYYSLPHAEILEKRWTNQLQDLSLSDDNQFPADLQQVHWDRYVGGIVAPASWLRQTDATLDDYL